MTSDEVFAKGVLKMLLTAIITVFLLIAGDPDLLDAIMFFIRESTSLFK